MVITRGEVWWADLGDPIGSAPGYRRPVIIVQGDSFNASRIATALCVPLTSNLKWADAPGTVLVHANETGLDRHSVANASLLLALDKSQLTNASGG